MKTTIRHDVYKALFAISTLALAITARAASFDCANAEIKVEHFICDNPDISKLDDDLAQSYKAALQGQTKTDQLKQAQREWLKKRDACADADCVKHAYESRLTGLNSVNRNSMKNGNVMQTANRTDDYVLDPEPKEMIDWNWEEYKKPEDKEVCSLYLQNLQYFARRSESLSCGQPIAPMLKDKIKPAEWENLDPDKYPDLFKAIIKEAVHFGHEEPSEEEIRWRKKDVTEHVIVFRRLKFNLKGSPGVGKGSNKPLPKQEYSIVQYGNDIINPENLERENRCQLKTGRKIRSIGAAYDSPRLFIATKSLNRIFGEILDWRGSYLQDLWLINSRIYGESYNEKGDVKLTQFRANHPVWFEAICLYHFKQVQN